MRFKSMLSVLVGLLAMSLMASFTVAQQDDAKKEEAIVCPVSGEKVLKSEAAGPYSYNSNEYYFCCNNCMEKFKKDPEAYLNNATDLVCGMTVDKRTAKKVAYEGHDYYFCSDNCKAAFEKDPKACMMKAVKASHEHLKGEKCKGCEHCAGEKTTKAGAEKGCCGDKATKK